MREGLKHHAHHALEQSRDTTLEKELTETPLQYRVAALRVNHTDNKMLCEQNGNGDGVRQVSDPPQGPESSRGISLSIGATVLYYRIQFDRRLLRMNEAEEAIRFFPCSTRRDSCTCSFLVEFTVIQ